MSYPIGYRTQVACDPDTAALLYAIARVQDNILHAAQKRRGMTSSGSINLACTRQKRPNIVTKMCTMDFNLRFWHVSGFSPLSFI